MSNFTLTAVDEKRAVMFGGMCNRKEKPRCDDVYVMHWDSMVRGRTHSHVLSIYRVLVLN